MASSSSETSPPAPLSSPSPVQLSVTSQPLMYKNRLQEFAQKSNIALPMYQTIKEGDQHTPMFRSTVLVDGVSYTTQVTFPQKKAAEQEAARLALENLCGKIGEGGGSSVSEVYCDKNRLQELAQKSNIALPLYQTINEGDQHGPKYRSTVFVDGVSYTSQLTFPQRKAAEQEAARLALESLPKKIKDEGHSLVSEDITFCKTIMNEYATKLNLVRPIFNTVKQEGLVCAFVSTVVFNGTSYTGDAARNKKDAEQLAARAAILSILGDSGSGTVLIEMIKSKTKFYDAIKRNGLQLIDASGMVPTANTGHTSVMLDHKDKEVAGPVADNNNETMVPTANTGHSSVMLDHKDKEVADPVADNNNETMSNWSIGILKLVSGLSTAEVPVNQLSPCSVHSNNVEE
ncbi:Double-stranded RNA-binding domain [Sesbania bispinosa]|nr:Double-stranded RNA-binding domain [Sesbania bispinosa]